MSNKFKFSEKIKRIERSKRLIMRELGENSVNFFKGEVFDRESWINRRAKRWEPRKVPDPSRRLLVNTGRMRQSGKVTFFSSRMAKVEFTVKYARYHNSGTSNLPKRKFIGNGAVLEKRNKKVLLKIVNRIMKS